MFSDQYLDKEENAKVQVQSVTLTRNASSDNNGCHDLLNTALLVDFAVVCPALWQTSTLYPTTLYLKVALIVSFFKPTFFFQRM
jgi:hypothetical protein